MAFTSAASAAPAAVDPRNSDHQAPHVARIQAAGTGSVRACLRSVAGCAPSTGSADHAGATTDLELTFNTDHSVGADQGGRRGCSSCRMINAATPMCTRVQTPIRLSSAFNVDNAFGGGVTINVASP